MAIFHPDLRPPCPALPDKPIFFLVISTILTLFTDSRETALVGWYFNKWKFTSSLTFLDKFFTEIVKHPFNSPLPSDWHPLPLWPSDNYITVTSVASDLISFIFTDSSPFYLENPRRQICSLLSNVLRGLQMRRLLISWLRKYLTARRAK